MFVILYLFIHLAFIYFKFNNLAISKTLFYFR